MALQFQIVVVTKHPVIPFYRFPCPSNIIFQDFGRHLASQASRADYQVFMIFLQVKAISTGPVIETVHPRVRHQLNQIPIAVLVLGKYNQVVSASVIFVLHLLMPMTRHIHLAPENGLERLQSLFLSLSVHIMAIVMKLLDTEHITMVGNSHTLHSVGNRLIHKLLDARLSIEQRIIGMNM